MPEFLIVQGHDPLIQSPEHFPHDDLVDVMQCPHNKLVRPDRFLRGLIELLERQRVNASRHGFGFHQGEAVADELKDSPDSLLPVN